MNAKLDLATRRLLAHYRAQPRASALHTIARGATSSGRVIVVLRAEVSLPRAA